MPIAHFIFMVSLEGLYPILAINNDLILGTGHSVGLDCHDVGGKDIGILGNSYKGRKGRPLDLNFNRALEENMVVTVEPGLYFNNVSIDVWTNNPSYKKFYNIEKINQYRVIGGVRIEDTVLVTAHGHDNFTIVPKEVVDIEAIMGHGRN
jgi:Xaa-Pro dipeptidase